MTYYPDIIKLSEGALAEPALSRKPDILNSTNRSVLVLRTSSGCEKPRRRALLITSLLKMQHRLVKAIVLMSFISASIGFSPMVHREAKIRIFDPLRNGFGSSSLARKDVNIQSPAPPNQDPAYTSRKISTFLRIKDDKSKPEINIAQQEQVSPATGVITVAGAGIEIDYDILRNYVAKNATTAQPATTVVQLDQPEHTTRSNRQLQALLDLTQTDAHRLYMDSKTTLPKHFGRELTALP